MASVTTNLGFFAGEVAHVMNIFHRSKVNKTGTRRLENYHLYIRLSFV